MKLHESRVLNNLDNFRIAQQRTKLMRGPIDMFLLWKTIEYFKPKKIIEIGFFAGQSTGIMLDAADSDAELTAVDISFAHKSTFDNVFPETNVTFIETDSLTLNLTEIYDFVLIDGDHSYEYALHDLKTCLPAMNKNSILYMDDYDLPGVCKVIQEELTGKNDFVPFLVGAQGMLFHHVSHSADEFLDVWIQDKAKNFIYFENNSTVFDQFMLTAKLPNLFVDHPPMFRQALEFYNL